MRRVFPFLLATACAPPPLIVLGAATADTGTPAPAGPAIELLFPEPGMTLSLGANCALEQALIVHVTGLELTAPDPGNDVEGMGHWHGGPDLVNGYCVSAVAFCDGSPTPVAGLEYQGGGLSPGSATLFVELQSNSHEPIGAQDQVEVTLEDDQGSCP